MFNSYRISFRLSNKKKVRGWPRQIRKIDQWFEAHQSPNLSALQNKQDTYVKIWIETFYQLEKRNLPQWYFKLVLDKMMNLHDLWEAKLKTTEIPHDLQLWFFERNYIESELVCASVSRHGELRNNFFRPCSEERSFPSTIFSTDSGNEKNFSWQVAYATHNYYEDLDDLKEPQMKKLLKQGFREEVINQGARDEQKVFWKPYDYVWIGRKKQE